MSATSSGTSSMKLVGSSNNPIPRYTARKRAVTPPPRKNQSKQSYSSGDESDSDESFRVKNETFSTDEEFITSDTIGTHRIRFFQKHSQENEEEFGVETTIDGEKRKRRRPRKETLDETSKGRKKVGRKRKVVEESNVPKKRGRGRPRKDPSTKEIATIDPPSKRSRGRPRKDTSVIQPEEIIETSSKEKQLDVLETPRARSSRNYITDYVSDDDTEQEHPKTELLDSPYESPDDVPETSSSDDSDDSDFEKELQTKSFKRRRFHVSQLLQEESFSKAESNEMTEDEGSKKIITSEKISKAGASIKKKRSRKTRKERKPKHSRKKRYFGPPKYLLLSYVKEENVSNGETWTENPFSKECRWCQQTFTCKFMFVIHEACYSQKRKMREMMNNPPTKEFECEFCWALFDDKKEFEKHAKEHFDPLFVCKVCDFTCNEQSDILKHSSSHDTPKIFTCLYPECTKNKFDDMNKSLDHVERAHFANYKPEESDLGTDKLIVGNIRKYLGPLPLPSKLDSRILKGGQMCFLEPYIGIRGERESYSDMYTIQTINYTCEICHQDFTDRYRELYKHSPCCLSKPDETSEEKYLCRICQKMYDKKQKYLFYQHLYHHRPPIYKCNFCIIDSPNEREAIIHTQRHTNESLVVCLFPGCAKDGSYLRHTAIFNISKHIRETHLEFSETTCDVIECALQFKSDEDLKLHKAAMHPELLIGNPRKKKKNRKKKIESNCTIKPPEFEGTELEKEEKLFEWLSQFVIQNKSKREIKIDGPRHTKIPFEQTCELCNRTFVRKEGFLVHIPCYYVKRSRKLMEEGIEEGARFECEFCQKTFDKIEQLTKHVKCHFDAQYKCAWPGCDFTARRSDRLSNHYDTHIKYFRAKCNIEPDVCQKEFDRERQAKEHILKDHLKYKYIQCEFCPERFANRRIYVAHSAVHRKTINRSRECPVCNVPISRQHSSMLCHLRAKHPQFDWKAYDEDHKRRMKELRESRRKGFVDIVDGELSLKETDGNLEYFKISLIN